MGERLGMFNAELSSNTGIGVARSHHMYDGCRFITGRRDGTETGQRDASQLADEQQDRRQRQGDSEATTAIDLDHRINVGIKVWTTEPTVHSCFGGQRFGSNWPCGESGLGSESWRCSDSWRGGDRRAVERVKIEDRIVCEGGSSHESSVPEGCDSPRWRECRRWVEEMLDFERAFGEHVFDAHTFDAPSS